MNYKTCEKMNDSFELDEKFDPKLVIRNNIGEVINRVPLPDPLAKGYIYACLYFYDEVQKEIDKLVIMINKIIGEIRNEVALDENNPAQLLLLLSTRVRNVIGDDSLDALIKNILAESNRHIALIPDQAELAKLMQIKEALFLELTTNFYNMTFSNSKEIADKRAFTFTPNYVRQLTNRQKRLLAPAIKMTGFIHQIRLNNFELRPDWSVSYAPERMPEPFDAIEETIKQNIKKLMEANS